MSAGAAALLAAVRRETGLTQAELARRAKTSQAMVARYDLTWLTIMDFRLK